MESIDERIAPEPVYQDTYPVSSMPPMIAAEPGVVPVASIIIVNYNGGDELIRCLDSVITNNLTRIEIILVDNASQDGSALRAARIFPHIRLVFTRANAGYGAGNNLGAEQARGKYLVFLNPDTIVESGWLKALIAALDSDPSAGLVTSKILLLDHPDQINACGNSVHLSGLTLCRGMGEPQMIFRKREYVNAISGAAFAIRRTLFEALGGFDPSFFLYMEDTDLSWRAQLAGYRCLFVPDSVVYHHYRLKFGPRKTYYQERNRYLMLLKTFRWTTLLALLPALLLAEVVTWGFVLIHDRPNWTNKLRAYGWVIGHWREIVRARRRAQALRRVADIEILRTTRYRLGYEQAGSGFPVRAAHWLFDPIFRRFQELVHWMFEIGMETGEDDSEIRLGSNTGSTV